MIGSWDKNRQSCLNWTGRPNQNSFTCKVIVSVSLCTYEKVTVPTRTPIVSLQKQNCYKLA